MYISIKLPPAFGSFNQIRKENYPFNNLFTSYLAAVSRLGLVLNIDVDDLVGYIEDTVFDGQRLPDVPEGKEPVNIRYKLAIPEDADSNCPGAIVKQYIEGSTLTNRMAIMYIARMTLRMSAAYGTSLLRLTRLINDLDSANLSTKPKTIVKQESTHLKQKVEKTNSKPIEKTDYQANDSNVAMPMPRVSSKSIEAKAESEHVSETVISPSASAKAAQAAVNALAGLAAEAEKSKSSAALNVESNNTSVVETNPFLNDFL